MQATNKKVVVGLSTCVLSACPGLGSPQPQDDSAVKTQQKTENSRPATRQLAERQDLPLAVRGALDARMARHGEQLTVLLAHVLMLDYEAAAELAEELGNEPPLGRPLPGDRESLNALLPAAFFDYQDQLRARAARLGQAARAKDRAELVAAFGTVTETCVACHAAYLDDELPVHAREP